jgi:hypothetical protein
MSENYEVQVRRPRSSEEVERLVIEFEAGGAGASDFCRSDDGEVRRWGQTMGTDDGDRRWDRSIIEPFDPLRVGTDQRALEMRFTHRQSKRRGQWGQVKYQSHAADGSAADLRPSQPASAGSRRQVGRAGRELGVGGLIRRQLRCEGP